MKLNLTYIITYLGILCVTLVPTSKSEPKQLRPTRNNQLIEGSGSGSGPGADDEDGGGKGRLGTGYSPKSPRPTPGRSSGGRLPGGWGGDGPTAMRSPSDLLRKEPRDEGSGDASDNEPEKPGRGKRPTGGLDGGISIGVMPKPTEPRQDLDRNRARRCEQAKLEKDPRLRPPYKPRCGPDGNFESLQCTEYDCFCVQPRTGNVIEKTRTVPKDEIVCHWIVFRLVIPLDATKTISRNDENRLETYFNGYSDRALMGGYEIISFVKFTPSYREVPAKVHYELRSIGHLKARIQSLHTKLERVVQKMREAGYPVGDPRLMTVLPVNKNERLPEKQEVRGGPTGAGLLPRDVAEKESRRSRLAGDETVDSTDYKVIREPGSNMKQNDESKKSNSASASTKKQDKAGKKGAQTLFEQPGIIAAIIGGGIAGFFLTILLILFCIYRIRKKDEGSYALEEPKKTPVSAAVYHSAPTREYYA